METICNPGKMATFRIHTIVYILLILNGNLVHSCLERFNVDQCFIEIYCNNGFDAQMSLNSYITYNYHNHLLNNNRDQYSMLSEDCVTITYNGNTFYPIHLEYNNNLSTYDDGLTSTEIPGWNKNYYDMNNGNVEHLITYIDLRNNNYSIMPTLREMENLVVLNLAHNTINIAKLTNKHHLPDLTEIDLSHNIINDIQNNIVDEYPYAKLIKLNLSHNYFYVIPEAVFEPFKELEILDLSHNFIDTLNQITFEGAKKLTHLNISNNKISDVNLSLFRFSELKVLDLSFNQISDIKANDFNKLNKLEILDLSNNLITNIEEDTFGYMLQLTSLYLNENKLLNLDKDTFKNVNLLTDVDISNNNFKSLPKGLFKNKAIYSFSIVDNQLEGSIDRNMFDGLSLVFELNLSYQHLETISDDAFFGLNKVEVILLNNNNIKTLSAQSFRMTQTLKKLDLSYNQIGNLNFEKVDLYNLRTLYLRNNNITVVKHENFHGLNALQYLDLSDNKITQVEINSFQSLKELINFEISNNPLSGVLKENTFDGLNSLPSLDISCTSLMSVQNGSFNGMVQLKNLNVSHSKISSLEYNTFIHTGYIEIIDLSYNNLKEFSINSTELAKIVKLYLNNNQIKILSSDTLNTLKGITVFSLSHNLIENIETHSFANQNYLRELDFSYNPLTVTTELINTTKIVDTLNLSGIRTGLSFDSIKDASVTKLIVSNCSVKEVKSLHINDLQRLDNLILSNNDISKLDNDGFSNIKTLRFLDLSYNKISIIQAGAFKDNILLYSLNVSHNLLTDISYGIFHGLTYLHTLDISFNNVRDLDNERFYEAKSLSVLIADHNKIESISAVEFLGTSLNYLSIGDNPIPCDVLVNLNRSGVPFHITASRIDFTNNLNVHGMSCVQKSGLPTILSNVSFPADGANVLLNIRDILMNRFNNIDQATATGDESENRLLVNLNENIEKLNTNIDAKLTQLINNTNQETPKANDDTNVLLQKMIKILTLISAKQTPTVELTKENATYDNLVTYINKIKQDLEASLSFEKDVILDEMRNKISALNAQLNVLSIRATDTPKHEKQTSISSDTKSYFTEICVGLILVILVCFVLFIILYKSGIVGTRQSFSVSTRELPGAMDSSL